MSSNKSNFFIFEKKNFLCINKNIYKDSSAKYFQYNKESLQKKLVKDIQIFLKKKKKKAKIWL